MFSRLFGTKTEHECTTQRHTKNTSYISDKSQVTEGWRRPCENWKNEDEIDETHKWQLKFDWIWRLFIKLHQKNKNVKTLIGFLRF